MMVALRDEVCQHAAEVTRDLEARCLSAIYAGLPDSYEVAVDAGLVDADLFACLEYSELFRVLMVMCQRRHDRPTIDEVRQTCIEAFNLRFQTRSGWGGDHDELEDLLLCECSSAGLVNYCRLIAKAARRRQQERRLWKALEARILDPFGDGRTQRAPRPSHRQKARWLQRA